MPRSLRWTCLLIVPMAASTALAEDPNGDEFFERQVRPLLSERCLKCHGDEKPKGGLKLTSRAAILKGGDTGPAAVAGNPDESLIVQAVRYEDEPKMPPKGMLPEGEIATLTRWVALGMPWPEAEVEPAPAAAKGPAYAITEEQRRFWSFQPVREVEPPAVKDAAWPRSGLDRFLLAAMESKGLSPSPPADKRTLIRRATFDLAGLPPTPEEVDAFLKDESPEAFARVVERLLASPRYGERWGRHWLDVVRYADSRDARGIGGADDIAEAWRYRDWVVDAFNRDLPYDKFIIDQIAGDLVPPEEPGAFNADALVATGLLAIGEWGTGDADKEKMMTDIVDDQIDVVGRAFLGLTLACARCHDHKFDPIPTEDYYSLAGIFFSTHILPDPGAKTAGSPLLRTPIAPKEAIESAERQKARIAELEGLLKKEGDAAFAALSQSLLPRTSSYMRAAWEFGGQPSASLDDFARGRGLRPDVLRRWIGYLGLGDDGRLMTKPIANVLGAAGVYAWKGEPDCPSLTVNTTDKELSLLTFKLPPRSVSVHPGPASAVAVVWKSPIAGKVDISGRLADGDPAGGDGVAWVVSRRRAASAETLAAGDVANGASQAIEAGNDAGRLRGVEVRPGDVIRLAVLPKNGHTCDTTTVAFTIKEAAGSATWDLADDLLPDPHAGGQGNPHADRDGRPGVWSFTELEDRGASRPGGDPTPLAEWDRAVAAGDPEAIERAADAFGRAVAEEPDAKFADELVSAKGPFRIDNRADFTDLPVETRTRLTGLREEMETLRKSLPPPFPLALAAQEGGVPKSAHEGVRDARIHIRGNYRRLGPVAPRRFPRILAGEDRAPITAGSGRLQLARWIARAEHPLASRVMVNRIWQYHFGEGIVRTPSNFGKLGERPTHPELLDYLARRFVGLNWSVKAMHREIMLSAAYRQSSRASPEAARADPDNRLFARMSRRRLEAEEIRDGLLAVAGRLDPAMGGPAYRDFATPRRTLYFMTIRSDRSSFGPMFDAADSTAIVDRRTSSTVAPQALFLLNNPFVLDAAKALADRLRAEVSDDGARVARAYALLYGRPPTGGEVEIGRALLSAGGDRAWEAYAQVLLCSNEFFYVD